MSRWIDKRAARAASLAQREREWKAEGWDHVKSVAPITRCLYPVLWDLCLTYMDDTQLLVYGLQLQVGSDATPAVRRGKRHVPMAVMWSALRWCVIHNAPTSLPTLLAFCEQCPRLWRRGQLHDATLGRLAVYYRHRACFEQVQKLTRHSLCSTSECQKLQAYGDRWPSAWCYPGLQPALVPS